ncbi:hypothetical protein MNEG_12864 [Monoraphidium neglectum]|uniref:Ketopantoate reductase N-terminal domain-containing protein n=1 Tax=Monoraphidium neglectum TaxID=145388 RepID=A0A0D2KH46_9CHLO|nr:hypothetical protein MNEG_12864 [Monoraphidium neglectum]KIY95098.1 hypothetical protein MNEG_12864 [Monoraphidium neglectum]|eukprot:XP_013894118.1 hypothetical protein MNEG_12864 [Monoraphidium neglectum]
MHPIVIGGGRVGTAISRMYAPRPAPILRRGEAVPDLPRPGADAGPIWVCTTNDALDEVIAATPQGRRGDLVFVQNGMLLPWLRERWLGGNTQVLLYMAADASGAVTDGRKTLAHGGRWAEHAAAALAGGGVACRVEAGWREFQEAVAAKLLWSSIFWVMSAALGETVGEIAENRSEEVAALVAELLPLVDDYLDDVIAADGRGDVTAGGVSHKGSVEASAAPAEKEQVQRRRVSSSGGRNSVWRL